MMEKVFDVLAALVFTATTVVGAGVFYQAVKREVLIRVSKGLSPTYKYTQKLTGERFDWEK